MAKRLVIFVFGVVSYMVFFAVFLYTAGFVGNIYVPHSMDAPQRVALWKALLIDCGLLGLFAVQHSVMARPWFKRRLKQFIPESAERSTYVMVSNLAMIVLFAYWQPIGGTVWNLEGATGRTLMNAILGLGFGLVLMASMLINHFDLFGLRQVWLQLIGKPYTELAFRTPLFYRYVRHPLYIGWMMMFWGTPTMSAAHLLFAGGTTAYMLMAMRWEERDLVKLHGAKYERYAQRVPRLIPAATAYSEPALLERKGSAA